MKPRIRLFRSVWDCRLPDYYTTGLIGWGYTAKEAYDDWLRNLNAYRRRCGIYPKERKAA